MQIETLVIIHDTLAVLTVPLSAALGIWYAPKYGFRRKKGASYALMMMFLLLAFTYACKLIPEWLGITGALNSYRSFLFAPLFALMLSRKWNISALRGVDFMTPILFFLRAVVMVGCTLFGCGLAMPCDWGIYSPNMGCRVFPSDLIDLLGNVVAGVIALVHARMLRYKGNGRIFALAMYIVGVIRLFLQFGTTEMWGIRGFNDESLYSIVSIIMAIVIYRNWQNNEKTNNKTEEQ